MNVGSDGSLCRITSSAKNYNNNIMILKIPDDEQQSSNLTYKLVSIFPDKNHESSSDKSDDDDDIYDKSEIKLGEINKNKDTKVLDEKKESTSKVINSKRMEHYKEQEFRTNTDWKKGRWISRGRTNPRVKKYRSSSISNSFVQKSTPPPGKDINPWLVSPQYMYPSYPIQNYSENYQPFNNVDPVPGTSSNCDISMTMGLLGDSPYSINPHQFHHNLNNFSNQNYWVEDYNSNDYPRPLPDMQTPLIKQQYSKGFQQDQRNKNWPNKRGKSPRGWKRNKVTPHGGRMKSNEYFSYHR